MKLTAPLRSSLSALKCGDTVYLSGTIFTARDMAHLRIRDILASGGNCPFPLKDQVIYYCGPSPAPPGRPAGSAGPTTAKRMDRLTVPVLEGGVKGVIGKGPRHPDIADALKTHRAVYLIAPGGCGALLSGCIRKCDPVAFQDLGPEAVYRLEVVDMPLVVGIDVSGNDIYRRMSDVG